MKKFVVIVITMVLFLSVQPVFASDYDVAKKGLPDVDIKILPDGGQIITVIETVPSEGIKPMASNTVTKSKTAYYKDASGKIMWYVKVTGTFTYGNGTAKCTACTPSAGSENAAWKIANVTGSKSGNKCSADADAKLYQDGKHILTVKETVTLTCSPTGQFS